MSTYSKFQTDAALELNGITLDLGEAGRFVIARAGGANKKFAKRFAELTKPYRRAIQTETLSEEIGSKLLRQVYIETVLLSWDGVTDENGEKLTFTSGNAEKLFSDLPWLFEEIRRTAEDAAIFRTVVQEADAKN